MNKASTIMVTIQIVDNEMLKIELGTKLGETVITPEDAIKYAESLIKKAEEAKAKRISN